MIKIKKQLARTMYYCGHKITLVPCKCSVDNSVAKAELDMNLDFCCDEEDSLTIMNRFSVLVFEFEHYNCCSKETGYHADFYVTEEALEQYEMCKMMCD